MRNLTLLGLTVALGWALYLSAQSTQKTLLAPGPVPKTRTQAVQEKLQQQTSDLQKQYDNMDKDLK